jgi:hypothetical protein
LIELGATDLLVPGVLPIGCFPLYLTLYNSSRKSDYNARTGCLRRYTRLAYHHNRELKQQLNELQKKYPKTKIMYGDYFKAAMQFVVSPGKFGKFFLSFHVRHPINMFKYDLLDHSLAVICRTMFPVSDCCMNWMVGVRQVSARFCELAAALGDKATTTST